MILRTLLNPTCSCSHFLLTFLFCPPRVCYSSYPLVRWWWVRWPFCIRSLFCWRSRYSARSGRWSDRAPLLHHLLPLGTAGCWEGSGGKMGLDCLFEGGGSCCCAWGCVCAPAPEVCPVLCPLLSLLSRHLRDHRSGGCCGWEPTAPSASATERRA